MNANLETLNGPDLVALFNEIAPQMGEKPVTKFKDLATGRRRVAALQAKANGGGKVSIADQVRLAKEESDLPEDIEEAKKALQEDFGDPDLPAPAAKKERRAKTSEPVEVDVNDKDSILRAFATRPGTNLDRLVGQLVGHIDQYVAANDLIAAVYGSKGGGLGALLMVLDGVKVRIATRSLPVELRRERSEPKNPRIGIFVVAK